MPLHFNAEVDMSKTGLGRFTELPPPVRVMLKSDNVLKVMNQSIFRGETKCGS